MGSDVQARLQEAQESGRLNLSYLPPEDLEAAISEAAAAGLTILDLDVSSSPGLDELPACVALLGRSLRSVTAKYNPGLTALPLEALARLPRLEQLDLEGCAVAAVEEGALQRLPALRRLNLASNGLAALPDGVAQCRALEALVLSNNPLAALPDGLAACPALALLDVSACRLAALPASLAQSRSLQRLFCQNNFLAKVPAALGNLRALKEWNLRSNRLLLKYEQAYARGLSKFLAFLREEEEIEALQEVERNRPVGVATGPCTVFKCKAVLEDATAAAAKGEPLGGFAWLRRGAAACLHRSSVLVLGGAVVREGGRKTAELLVLNLDRMEWRVQPTKGEGPSPRDGHAMAVDPSGRQLLVFGGRKENGRRTNDLHLLSLDSWTWFTPKQDAAALPPPREQCSAAFADGRLLVFGGRTNGARLNDLWMFDTSSWRWEQLPVQGTAPSPRQGAACCAHAGQLWVVGGQGNFVLDDAFVYSLERQEWKAVGINGIGGKLPARAGGHVIAPDGPGSGLWMFGGHDALGAAGGHLLHLRQKPGGARYEWVESELAFPPDRSRLALFDEARGRLCGHPLHKLYVSAEQLEQGGAVWDVTQTVELEGLQERVVSAAELAAANPKRERIRHASLTAAKLPRAFSINSPREQQLLAAAAAYRQRWMAGAAEAAEAAGARGARLMPAVSLLNECEAEKMVCNTLRPAALPHLELYDLEGVAQFVAEFFAYEPLEDPARPPTHLVSPWSVLEWQAGDSFDLASLACSLLLGAGYDAHVAVGYVPKHVALGDQSLIECPGLAEHGVQPPPYAELPEPVPSFEAEEPERDASMPAAGAVGTVAENSGAPAAEPAGAPAEAGLAPPEGATGSRPATAPAPQATAAAAVAPETDGTQPAEAVPPPAIDGPASSAEAPAPGTVPCSAEAAEGEPQPVQQPQQQAQQPPRLKQYVHAFVLVRPGRREVTQPLLLDPATGALHSLEAAPCTGVEWVYNSSNFWLNQQRRSAPTSSSSDGDGGMQKVPPHGLAEVASTDFSNLSNPNCWLPLLTNGKEEDKADASTVASFLTGGSRFVAGRSAQQLGGGRSSPAMERPSSTVSAAPSKAAFTPRAGQPPPGSPSAAGISASSASMESTPSAAALAAAGGSPLPRAGLALQHLATGGQGGPKQGGSPSIGAVHSSLAYLAPDESSLQRSALAAGHSGASPLGPDSLPTAAGGHSPLPPPPEMPLSWVPPLALSRERLDMRCPRGEKAVHYRQAQREVYASYGECSRWDGLVERITTFADAGCSAPLCVLELFARRKDRLERRQAWLGPEQRVTLSTFGPGAASCVKSIRVTRAAQPACGDTPSAGSAAAAPRRQGEGVQVELTFFSDRPDGLMRRVHSACSLEESFAPGSRPDRLLHRVVQYAAPAADDGPGGEPVLRGSPSHARGSQGARHHHSSTVGAGLLQPAEEREVACIHEQYGRPEAGGAPAQRAAGRAAAPAGLLERRFDLAAGRLQLVMQAGQGACGGPSPEPTRRTYSLDGELLEAGGPEAPCLPAQQVLEHAAMRAAAQAAQAAGRAAEEEAAGILAARQRQEQSCQLAVPHYYACRVKVEDSDGEGEGEADEDDYDSVQHFMPKTGARDMTAAEAEGVRAACLAAFDDRMSTRRSLLLTRLAESSAEVDRLRALLASGEQAHLSPADAQRLEAEEAAATFRLKVVQRRVEEHGPRAAARRREMEAKLASDKRLVSALAGG